MKTSDHKSIYVCVYIYLYVIIYITHDGTKTKKTSIKP